jgi:alpha,alpha-trehalase
MNTNYQDVMTYITQYWGKSAFSPGKKPEGNWRNTIMGIGYVPLPNGSIAANHDYFACQQFYWDSYFIILGLVVTGYSSVARNMVDNLCFLYDEFGLVPARNSKLSRGRSQPPYLTRMAWEVYEHTGADESWLKNVLAIAQKEYETVWMGKRRLLDIGLSRYNPRYFPKKLTMYESGWDRSTRFADSPRSIVPVDLNCQLYMYEDDLLNWAQQHDQSQVQIWQERMDRRRALVTQYFWDEETGFFYDYDFRAKKQRRLKTLAGFYPMWAGIATPEQAARCVEHLKDFEHDFGLASTEVIPWHGRQWDAPNGWAPLQYIVVSALRRYGYNAEALQIVGKWLNLNKIMLKGTGSLWEQYDVVKGKVGLPGRYPVQSGFSWTCAVFARLVFDWQDDGLE